MYILVHVFNYLILFSIVVKNQITERHTYFQTGSSQGDPHLYIYLLGISLFYKRFNKEALFIYSVFEFHTSHGKRVSAGPKTRSIIPLQNVLSQLRGDTLSMNFGGHC